MSSAPTLCPGCGLERPVGGAVYEGYFHASAECWNVFLGVMTREYENPVLFAQVHQISVDAYAVQHAGGQHPDKSVCVHLVGLYWALERGVAPVEVPRRLQALAGVVTLWPHFAPPPRGERPTIALVSDADTPTEHADHARTWARAVWNSWKVHHAAIAELAQRCYGLEGSTAHSSSPQREPH